MRKQQGIKLVDEVGGNTVVAAGAGLGSATVVGNGMIRKSRALGVCRFGSRVYAHGATGKAAAGPCRWVLARGGLALPDTHDCGQAAATSSGACRQHMMSAIFSRPVDLLSTSHQGVS